MEENKIKKLKKTIFVDLRICGFGGVIMEIFGDFIWKEMRFFRDELCKGTVQVSWVQGFTQRYCKSNLKLLRTRGSIGWRYMMR